MDGLRTERAGAALALVLGLASAETDINKSAPA